EPLHYMRPRLEHGSWGAGVIRCTALEGRGLDRDQVCKLFSVHGGRDDRSRPYFASQRQMIAAAQAAGLVPANSVSGGSEFVGALKRELGSHFDASPGAKRGRPVWWREGKRNAEEFVWMAGLEPAKDDEDDVEDKW